MKKTAHSPPTCLCVCLALSQASHCLSLFLSVSLSIVISQQIQFIQNEIVSCSSEFGFFFFHCFPNKRSVFWQITHKGNDLVWPLFLAL